MNIALLSAFSGLPVLVWQTPLPGVPEATASRAEPGSPVVGGNLIYLGYSGQHSLLVLDARDGRQVGALPARGMVMSAPILLDDRVIFADSAGYTHCYLLNQVRLASPTAAWSHYSGAPVVGSPTVSGAVVFLANVDDVAYALDVKTGDLRWRYAHSLDAARSGSLELYGAAAPVPDGKGAVWLGFSDGFVVGLSEASGNELVNMQVGEGAYPDIVAPVLPHAGGLLASGFTGPTVMLNPEARSVQWRVEAGTAASVLEHQGQAYIGGTDGKLRRVDLRTGALAWTWDGGLGGTVGDPVWTDAGILVTLGEGSMYLVDSETGVTRWTLDPGVLVNGIAARPAVSGDTAYIVSNAGVVYAVRVPKKQTELPTAPWVR